MRDHKIFVITISYRQRTGIWHDHDDFEFTGWAKTKTTEQIRYVAPSEEVALAHCRAEYKHYNPGQDFTISEGNVEALELHAVLLSPRLD